MNFGLSLAELQSGKPIIVSRKPAAICRLAIATISFLPSGVREGIREAAAFRWNSRASHPGNRKRPTPDWIATSPILGWWNYCSDTQSMAWC